MKKEFNIGGFVGCALTILALLTAAFGPSLIHADPNVGNLMQKLLSPGTDGHLLGTDQLGRDILSRIISGARTSLSISLISVLLSMLIGTVLGLLSGYYEGFIDVIISRILELQMAIPTIVLALIIASLIRTGTTTIIIILVLTGWVIYTRMVRGAILSMKNEEYIQAAKSIGCSDFQIIFQHILPNIFPTVIVIATLEIGKKIILESTLSYLGVGLQPPTVSWGQILNEGQNYLAIAWWICLFSGMAPALAVLGFNLFGDYLREKLDPKVHGS